MLEKTVVEQNEQHIRVDITHLPVLSVNFKLATVVANLSPPFGIGFLSSCMLIAA